MKERPILFSAPMVRAILEGRKTQTRRVVKPQPNSACLNYVEWKDEYYRPGEFETSEHVISKCPYGKPGDRLWVRENFWRWGRWINSEDQTGERSQHWAGEDIVGYPASHPGEAPDSHDGFTARKFPSIHMPRWASRIDLPITAVRVERLQDISEADALAEGVAPNWLGDINQGPNGRGGSGWSPVDGYKNYLTGADGEPAETVRRSFETLWQSINGPASWDANPWIWAIQFERAKP